MLHSEDRVLHREERVPAQRGCYSMKRGCERVLHSEESTPAQSGCYSVKRGC